MTQEKLTRDEIRRKTAQAIMMIDDLMQQRRKLPNPDNHDVNDIKSVARNLGEVFVRNLDKPDFDPLALLLAEARNVDEYPLKQRAEAGVALGAMAKAFDIEHQFVAATSAEAYAKAHPPEEGRSTGR